MFQSQKRNIERLAEQTSDVEYNLIHHFISESPWDHRAGFDQLSRDTGTIFSSIDCDWVGLLLDESAHVKKGEHSVGVSRQWCGTGYKNLIQGFADKNKTTVKEEGEKFKDKMFKLSWKEEGTEVKKNETPATTNLKKKL